LSDPEIEVPHILCVDDEADILSITKLCLETVGGFRVSCCMSGGAAVEGIQSISPDLVLLDVMMPNMGGPATLLKLKAMPANIYLPIVFMTARVQPAEVQAYMDLGASAVISKPFDPMELPTRVRQILADSRNVAN